MADDGHFGETVAATYDDDSDPVFAPEVVNRTVDVLAELARDGRALELRDRWADWKREPFMNDSRQHVSVWTRGAEAPQSGPNA